MTTILETFGHRPATGYKSKHGESSGLAAPDLLVGLELEIEEFDMHESPEFGGVHFTTDGSLRNGGIEAITRPIAMKHVPPMLSGFFEKYGVDEGNYSDRCSTHVHVNVLPMTFHQLSTLALVYQTAERLLFNFVGNDRHANIFCVPWFQSGITFGAVKRLEKSDSNVLREWQKYSALNLLPVVSQGTVEFRHLHGTCDVKLITGWLNIIGSMVNYSMNHTFHDAKRAIIGMNTVSNYREWLTSVFGKFADLLMVNEMFEVELSQGVVDSKFMLMERAVSSMPTGAPADDPLFYHSTNPLTPIMFREQMVAQGLDVPVVPF